MFSPNEQKILQTLRKKRMTITQLAQKIYKDLDQPLEPNNVVASCVRRINHKCDYHKLPWFLNSYGLGRAGKTVWVDKR